MLINCTPHDITILDEKGEIARVIAPSGIVTRVEEIVEHKANVADCGVTTPLVTKGYGQVSNLPVQTPGFVYIVSYLVLQALHGTRPDCICPDTGPDSVVRVDGRVKGVRRFQR